MNNSKDTRIVLAVIVRGRPFPQFLLKTHTHTQRKDRQTSILLLPLSVNLGIRNSSGGHNNYYYTLCTLCGGLKESFRPLKFKPLHYTTVYVHISPNDMLFPRSYLPPNTFASSQLIWNGPAGMNLCAYLKQEYTPVVQLNSSVYPTSI